MNALPRSTWLLTVDEYLAFEEQSDVRHEYLDGEIYAMVGASRRHSMIVSNIAGHLWTALRGSSCETHTNEVKLQVAETAIYYPDVVVTCDPTDVDPYIVNRPLFVSEVLSPSTAGIDRREKARLYRLLSSLRSYLIVSQDEQRVDFYWRAAADDEWRFDVHFDGAVQIPGIDVRLTLAEIYEGVEFSENSS
jgi:Uma2 family endonuclease